MKTTVNSYELKGTNRSYDRISHAIKSEARPYSINDGREFCMRDGKVKLQLRRFADDGVTILDAISTSQYEPEFVGRVVKRLEGKVGCSPKNSTPDETVNIYLDSKESSLNDIIIKFEGQ